jgi:hypothetical protein
MKEVENIVQILRDAKRFVEADDANELKRLSNQTVHVATISQDADNIVVAVLIYSLGKVMERGHYRNMEGWDKFYGDVVGNLSEAVSALEKGNVEDGRVCLGRIRNSLNEIESDLGRYIKDVFRKAEINKAFKLYENGLSSEQTAEMLGVSLWDMASYIGQSHIGDSKIAVSMPQGERVKIVEGIFG